MMIFLKAKLAAVLISAVAVTAVAGTTVVAATQHAGPFAPGAVFGGQKTTTAVADDHQNFHAQGLIQQVTFSTGATTSGTLTLLPNGQTKTVVVSFTAQTHVEVNGDSDGKHAGSTTGGTTRGAAALTAGLSANVVGTLQHDGTVLAREIQANANGKAHQGGDGHAGDKHDFAGKVQSVDFTAMTFVMLPAGKTQPVTIVFDTNTKIEAHGNLHGATALIIGAQVEVHTTTRADGALYANAIDVQMSGHGGDVTPTPVTNGHKP